MNYNNIYLDTILVTLSRNPSTIKTFNDYYKEFYDKPFHTNRDFPEYPKNFTVATIRETLSLRTGTDEEVLAHWDRVSADYGINFKSYNPNVRTKYDIPQIIEELEIEWKKDLNAEGFKNVEDYKKFLSGDGIIQADLRQKEIRYLNTTFNIPRKRPTTRDLDLGIDVMEYSLQAEWKIIKE